MPGIGNILALLGGAGQGYAQSQAQAPINAYNQNLVQQQQQTQQDTAGAMSILQGLAGGGNASSPTPPGGFSALPQSGGAPAGLPSSPVGGSIMPMQPGQPSVPMQRPPVATAPSAAAPPPAPPPPQPQNAPVNQTPPPPDTQAQNPLLPAYAKILQGPGTPGAKRRAIEILSQLQQVQAAQQRQQLQDQFLQQKMQLEPELLESQINRNNRPSAAQTAGSGAPTLDDGSIDMLADQYAKTGKLPAGLGYRMTADKRAIIERAREKHPDVDLADAGASYAGEVSGNRAVGTSGSRIMLAANSLDQAIPLARDAIKKVDLTNYPSVNAIENAVRSGTGDPNIVAANTAIQTVISDYSSLIARTGQQTDGTRAIAKALANTDMSIPQLNAVFNQIQKEKIAQLKAVKQTKSEIGGGGQSVDEPAPVVLFDDLKE